MLREAFVILTVSTDRNSHAGFLVGSVIQQRVKQQRKGSAVLRSRHKNFQPTFFPAKTKRSRNKT